MNDESPIILLDGSTAGTLQTHGLIDVVEMRLDVACELLPIRIGVREGDAKLADLAPMARALSSRITDIGVRHFENKGETIPCRKGCAACCHYIVVLTAPDAFCLIEQVLTMPQQQRKKVIKSFGKANEWFGQQHSGNPLQTGVLPWYCELRYPCPFLHENQCTIYENRPIACREWMVTGTNHQCLNGNKVKRILPSIHIGDVLKHLAVKLEDKTTEDVIFPTVFEWYSHNIDRSKRTWPAKMMVEQFVEILNKMSN